MRKYILLTTQQKKRKTFYLILISIFISPVPAYARQVVYDYHIQNTYNLDDWELIFRDYEFVLDENEHRKLLTSLTFTRLPWLLEGFET